MKKEKFWRNWYLTSAAVFFPIFGLFAWFAPMEETRAKSIAAIILFVPIWIHGILFIAPSLDGDSKWK